ncbi:kinesin-like nuclear fusion protein [Elasticomyces elasticus]|uniref:Kinesin-like protein n=1 Tax=Exophiala sideris TaxID=1016849 RepID=A0ABR0IYN9_9EURO|nr:kinesin-like nuclear fusion protein [Elasticomyces elasticus]KAK5022543.1 kinesin-like nuclear fusion protein [Exophiala sideris]KAK5028071.1 kinesin-like nuclear fusion protein [Exophiala sideris]KAK5051812.1 kinesin-like nuclear fusion protein [Exophiala sideris]KAK5177856.1 kinesin-like nuclear fusion protein [Eurotiomycetes sp. CCFEE 6388]
MADTENFVSQLPQPTRSGQPSPQKQLTELSASANNSRNAMPPPTFPNHKRQGSNCLSLDDKKRWDMLTTAAVPEPASKRKTLAERAGEPLRAPAAPRSSVPVNSAVMSAVQSRNPSAFSQSTRSNSSQSRNTSASTTSSTFSMSVGSGIRPPAVRPTSSLARPKSFLAKERGAKLADTRPATSLETRGGSQDGPNNKRMVTISDPLLRFRAPAPLRNTTVHIPKRNDRSVSPMKGLGQTVRPPPIKRETPRTWSITARMAELSMHPETPKARPARPDSTSRLPRPSPSPGPKTPAMKLPFNPPPWPKAPLTSPLKTGGAKLTKFSDLEAWDPEEQYNNMERMYEDVCKHYKQAVEDNVETKEINTAYRTTVANLEQERKDFTESMITLRCELEKTKFQLEAAERSTHDLKRDFEEEEDGLKREHRIENESMRQAHRDDMERLKADHREEIRELKRRLEDELESERTQRLQALSQVSTQGALEKQRHQMDLEAKEQELRIIQGEVERLGADLEREKMLNDELRQSLSSAGNNAVAMESARQASQAKIEFLESDSKSQSEAYADMEKRMTEALEKAVECEEKLRKEELLRRKLHNQVQELKGNIRVFCRVRPTNKDDEEETVKFMFPECDEEPKDIEVKGPEETNSLGKITTKTHQFSFDRVFDPSSNNAEIFEEISQLIQSALDGYNVCIFAYGQTGSGKTYTMSSDDGMIPLALRQIYSTSKELESRGWTYTMKGSFVEVYNEELRDLLGKEGENEKGTKKHEIRHDMATCETTITDVTTLSLDNQEQVEGILSQAMSRRSVAATKANERSSRSHSVFILKLSGHNSITGKTCKGTLNLVDLAGSERLSHSKVEGARLKETQNINKSLSCLGDVIGALGQQQGSGGVSGRESVNGSSASAGSHIPYRNSKLTYLLQFSLGGNSKTLMFVMVAPEKKCLSETITSLKFADKVSRTRIGVARRTSGK